MFSNRNKVPEQKEETINNDYLINISDEKEEKHSLELKPDLIDLLSKNKIHEYAFFENIPKLLQVLNSLAPRNWSVFIPSYLEIIENQNSTLVNLLFHTLSDNGRVNFENNHLMLLVSCIIHATPQIFENLLEKLDIDNLSQYITSQLYRIAVQYQRNDFCQILINQDIAVPPQIVAIAHRYHADSSLILLLWNNLHKTDKRKAINFLLAFLHPDDNFNSLKLPSIIHRFYEQEEEFEDPEIKESTLYKIPILKASARSPSLIRMNRWVKNGDFAQLIIHLKTYDTKHSVEEKFISTTERLTTFFSKKSSPPSLFSFFYNKIKEFPKKEIPIRKEIQDIINFNKCIQEDSLQFVNRIMEDAQLLENTKATRFFLSLFDSGERGYSLVTRWLAEQIILQPPFNLKNFHIIYYLTQSDQDYSIDVIRRELLLPHEIKILEILLTPLAQNNPSLLLVKLGVTLQQLHSNNYMPGNLPLEVQIIIKSYLTLTEDIQICHLFPALNMMTNIEMQRQRFEKQLADIEELIIQLREFEALALLNRPSLINRVYRILNSEMGRIAAATGLLGGGFVAWFIYGVTMMPILEAEDKELYRQLQPSLSKMIETFCAYYTINNTQCYYPSFEHYQNYTAECNSLCSEYNNYHNPIHLFQELGEILGGTFGGVLTFISIIYALDAWRTPAPFNPDLPLPLNRKLDNILAPFGEQIIARNRDFLAIAEISYELENMKEKINHSLTLLNTKTFSSHKVASSLEAEDLKPKPRFGLFNTRVPSDAKDVALDIEMESLETPLLSKSSIYS